MTTRPIAVMRCTTFQNSPAKLDKANPQNTSNHIRPNHNRINRASPFVGHISCDDPFSGRFFRSFAHHLAKLLFPFFVIQPILFIVLKHRTTATIRSASLGLSAIYEESALSRSNSSPILCSCTFHKYKSRATYQAHIHFDTR